MAQADDTTFWSLYQGLVLVTNEIATLYSTKQFDKYIRVLAKEAKEMRNEVLDQTIAGLSFSNERVLRADKEYEIRKDFARLVSGMFALAKEVQANGYFEPECGVDPTRDYDVFDRVHRGNGHNANPSSKGSSKRDQAFGSSS